MLPQFGQKKGMVKVSMEKPSRRCFINIVKKVTVAWSGTQRQISWDMLVYLHTNKFFNIIIMMHYFDLFSHITTYYIID